MKPTLLLALFLLCAVPVCAQRGSGGGGHSGSGPVRAGGAGTPYYGGGGGGEWFGTDIGAADFGALPYDPPTDFGIVSAANDGAFVPSRFMNYEDALELGKQELAAAQGERKGEVAISLGEFARSYRANKIPSFRMRSRIVQDDAGKMQMCNLNGTNCHSI
jgi:hypothetical protein